MSDPPDLPKQMIEPPPFCLWGWESPRPCNYTGGCVCLRTLGHNGMCFCEMCGSRKKRPADWDAHGREEANR